MNKYIISIIGIFFFIIFGLKAQNPIDPVCLPDSTFADSIAGVYPGPYHPELFPNGGIHDTACINHPFELVFTAVVSDSISYSGLQLKLNHLKIEENGVLNLPSGLSYACNPPNCLFESNTLGCMLISGTPDESNPLGSYDLELESEIVAANGLITLHETLPQFLIPDSHYYLELASEDSGICTTSGLKKTLSNFQNYFTIVNPVQEAIHVSVLSNNEGFVVMELIDLQGRVLKRQKDELHAKEFIMEINSLDLKSDIYILKLNGPQFSKAYKIVILD